MELIEVTKEGAVSVVAPTVKRLDASVAPAFKQAVVQVVEGGDRQLLLDLAGVDFLDSSGLGALVSILKAMGGKGSMAVCGARGAVLSLFKLTRMDKVFTLYPDRKEALARAGRLKAAMREAELSLHATLAEVARVTEQLRQMLPEWLEGDERDAIELGIAEALTNIVKHGYGGDTAETVLVRLFERPGGLEVEVLDRGTPIPPGMLEQADETTFFYDPSDLAALPEGGMGLALIKAAFDEVSYRRKSGINRLKLVRRI